MRFYLKCPIWARNIVINSVIGIFGMGFTPILDGNISKIWANAPGPDLDSPDIPQMIISENSALISSSSPNNPEPEVVQKMGVVVTAYSSTVWQTDDDPYVTAAGTQVRDGIIANNYLSFGTKVRIPELFGDKVFVVEDRMSWKKGNYHFDIWFPDYWQALSFGAKRTYIEVLEG